MHKWSSPETAETEASATPQQPASGRHRGWWIQTAARVRVPATRVSAEESRASTTEAVLPIGAYDPRKVARMPFRRQAKGWAMTRDLPMESEIWANHLWRSLDTQSINQIGRHPLMQDTQVAKTDEPVSKGLVAHMLLTQVPNIAQSMAEQVVTERDYQRQIVEDTRANRRNFNRMMTLFGALLISLIVTYVLSHPGTILSKSICKTWGPYSFAITILLDSALTVYAYLRHY